MYEINNNVDNPGTVVTFVHKGQSKTVSLTGNEIVHKYKDKGREITKIIPPANQDDLKSLFEMGHYMVIEKADEKADKSAK